MHSTFETEEYLLLQTIITHYANQLHAERGKVADLTRRLECERERVQLLESAAYGCSFL